MSVHDLPDWTLMLISIIESAGINAMSQGLCAAYQPSGISLAAFRRRLGRVASAEEELPCATWAPVACRT